MDTIILVIDIGKVRDDNIREVWASTCRNILPSRFPNFIYPNKINEFVSYVANIVKEHNDINSWKLGFEIIIH